MATIKKLIQDAPRMRGVTPVPNGPLVKKKGEFKGSTLKAGGWIKKAAASIKRRGTEAEVIPVRKPLVNPDGSVDYRELGHIIMVQKGNLLMQRIPPIPGEPGRNVFNEIVEPGGGVDIPFTLDQRGVYVNPSPV